MFVLNDPVLTHEWFAVARSIDVTLKQPLPISLLGLDAVLWRNEDGVHAWQDLCIHRGAKLSLGSVRDGCLICPYHGWRYDSSGRCVHIPAQPAQAPPLKAHANVLRVVEEQGFVWVSLGNPSRQPVQFSESPDETYRKLLGGPYFFRAQGPRILENFLDVSHLAIVHNGLLGDAAHAQMADYEVEVTQDGLVARDIEIWQPDPDGAGRPARVSYTFEVHRPLVASFRKLHNGQCMLMALFVTPVDDQRSVAWAFIAMNYAHDIPAADLLAFQDRIVAQDKPVVESQRPELLPLDLQAELHLRSDKTAIAYRRWLGQLGMAYGIA